MITNEARQADERGYRAVLQRLDGGRIDDSEIADLVADILVFAEIAGHASADEIARRALGHARAELDGDDLTTWD